MTSLLLAALIAVSPAEAKGNHHHAKPAHHHHHHRKVKKPKAQHGFTWVWVSGHWQKRGHKTIWVWGHWDLRPVVPHRHHRHR